MPTVLVVDDLPTNRELLVMLLGLAGFKVLEAGDGVGARRVMRDCLPDLVVTDVRMPTVDGYELVKRMRVDPLLAKVPVIFYTAAGYEREARALAEGCGVTHVLLKPSDPQELLRAVSSALGIALAFPLIPPTSTLHRRAPGPTPAGIDSCAVVHIVDDDRAVRRSLSLAMSSASLQVETYCTAEKFLSARDLSGPGCLVVDIRMPGMSGIELLEILRSRQVDVSAIIHSAHGDVPAAVRSMKLQVLDFLQKPVDPCLLLAKVYEGLRQDTARWVKRRETDVIRQRMETLSQREWQLLDLVIAGASSKAIAPQLGITVKTVDNHRAHLLAKTHAANTADLVRMRMIAGNRGGSAA